MSATVRNLLLAGGVHHPVDASAPSLTQTFVAAKASSPMSRKTSRPAAAAWRRAVTPCSLSVRCAGACWTPNTMHTANAGAWRLSQPAREAICQHPARAAAPCWPCTPPPSVSTTGRSGARSSVRAGSGASPASAAVWWCRCELRCRRGGVTLPTGCRRSSARTKSTRTCGWRRMCGRSRMRATRPPPADKPGPWTPVLWTREWEGARVVYDALGHNAKSLDHPVHRQLIARAAGLGTGA